MLSKKYVFLIIFILLFHTLCFDPQSSSSSSSKLSQSSPNNNNNNNNNSFNLFRVCDCSIFDFAAYDQVYPSPPSPPVIIVSNSTTPRTICCTSKQLHSFDDEPNYESDNPNQDYLDYDSDNPDPKRITKHDWHRIESQIDEIYLRNVRNPYALIWRRTSEADNNSSRLTALNLFDYDLRDYRSIDRQYRNGKIDFNSNSTIIDNYRCSPSLERVHLHRSLVPAKFLEDLAHFYHKLHSIHLESIHVIATSSKSSINLKLKSKIGFRIFSKQFRSASEIRVINLIDCEIESLLGVDLLRRMGATIRTISLSRNRLKMIDNLHFFPDENNSNSLGVESKSNWWSLDLSYNMLGELPAGWRLPASLRVLKLDHNRLITISFDAFVHVWNGLSELWLQANSFDCSTLAQSFKWISAVRQKSIPPFAESTWYCYNGTQRLAVVHFLSTQ